VIKIGVGYVF